MTAVLPLAIYPWPPKPEQLAAIKEAREYLANRDSLDFKIQPSAAVPAGPGRVMAFAPPPFLCHAAIVRSLEATEVRKWLEWCLDDEIDVKHGMDWDAWLAWRMPGTREVTHEYSGADLFAMEQAREDAKERGVRFD